MRRCKTPVKQCDGQTLTVRGALSKILKLNLLPG